MYIFNFHEATYTGNKPQYEEDKIINEQFVVLVSRKVSLLVMTNRCMTLTKATIQRT